MTANTANIKVTRQSCPSA